MTWEMAMPRALISCRPQIPWDPARSQETGAPLECQMVCLILLSKKKESVLSVIPGYAHCRCQELKDGFRDVGGREKLEKNPLFIPGNIERKTSPCHWVLALSQSCFSHHLRSILPFPSLSAR